MGSSHIFDLTFLHDELQELQDEDEEIGLGNSRMAYVDEHLYGCTDVN